MDIYGVIGYPVKHTLSPLMHNAAFKRCKIDAIYLPFEVHPKDLKDVIKIVFRIGIKGLNVTVPHKERCMRFLDSIDKVAEAIGAVNTIVLKKERLIGYNTDADGFIMSLRKDLGFEPKGKSVFVLGAGGASRAVNFILAKEGVKEIRIVDLIRRKAKGLADSIGRLYPSCKIEVLNPKGLYTRNDLEGIDLIINATTIGMNDTDPLVFEKDVFREGLSIYDLIYNPHQTKLVKTASSYGARACGGLGMLLYQGARSFEMWTGRDAPLEVMKTALSFKENIGQR